MNKKPFFIIKITILIAFIVTGILHFFTGIELQTLTLVNMLISALLILVCAYELKLKNNEPKLGIWLFIFTGISALIIVFICVLIIFIKI